jgi:lysine 2,3-aminomutase
MTHINHPDELSPATIEACSRLVDAGIPLVNQTVLLRGINDDASLLQGFFERLLELRIRPYYLHQMDLTRGTAHFRTRIEDGLAIMSQLRGTLSGLAIPHFVVDLPGGHGKIPLVPEYVECLGEHARFRAADGTLVEYPNTITS